MTKLKESLAYILETSQKVMPLNTVNSLLYLSDWKHAIDSFRHQTITQSTWFKSGDKPYNKELYQILDDNLFEIKEVYGAKDNFLISLRHHHSKVSLDKFAKSSMDFIISKVNTKSWEDISTLVASTLPMLTAESSSVLPIEDLAKFYAEEIRPKMREKELHAA